MITTVKETENLLRHYTRESYDDEYSDYEALSIIRDNLLGKDWYVVDPIGQRQVNYIAVKDMVSKIDNLKTTNFIYKTLSILLGILSVILWFT